MGYLWTKYLKLRFLGLVPLFPDLTRWLGTAALNKYNISNGGRTVMPDLGMFGPEVVIAPVSRPFRAVIS